MKSNSSSTYVVDNGDGTQLLVSGAKEASVQTFDADRDLLAMAAEYGNPVSEASVESLGNEVYEAQWRIMRICNM